jgi:hypothetical protein
MDIYEDERSRWDARSDAARAQKMLSGVTDGLWRRLRSVR